MSSQTAIVNNLNSISNSILYYGLWTILPTCVIGNIISLIVFTRPSLNKKTNTGFLYSWLCILNIVTMVYYCTLFRGNTVFNLTISAPCGLIIFFQRILLNMISWLQVYICLDRFVAVYYPTKIAFMSKKIVLYGIMLGLLVFIIATSSTNLIQTASLNAKNVTVCTQTYEASLATILISNLNRVFIPFILMLALNLAVIRNLKQSKVRVNVTQIASTQNNQNGRQISNKELRFMVSTLIIDFMYLIFYLPFGVGFIVQTYNLFSTSLTSDAVGFATFNVFAAVVQTLALGHTSALFFVFLIFNRLFRAELIILIRLDRLFSSLKPRSSAFFTKVNNSVINNTVLRRSNVKSSQA